MTRRDWVGDEWCTAGGQAAANKCVQSDGLAETAGMVGEDNDGRSVLAHVVMKAGLGRMLSHSDR